MFSPLTLSLSDPSRNNQCSTSVTPILRFPKLNALPLILTQEQMILKAIHVGQSSWKKPHWASRGSFHTTQTRNAYGDRIQCSLKNLLLFLNILLDSFAQEQVYLSSISIIPLYKLLYIRRTGFLRVGNVSIQLMCDPSFWAPLFFLR